MTHEERFEELLEEFERIGVDPNSFPAGITVRRDDALRVLRTLPDGAGPAAFLAAIRVEQLNTRADISGAQSAAD